MLQLQADTRARLPFRAVNRRGAPDYDPSFQRHHLLPRQLLSRSCFRHMFDWIEPGRVGFDDFRANGLLLPANENTAQRVGLPMHRGPHRRYNQMVIERVGSIERDWSRTRIADPRKAIESASMRMRLLQTALRKRLLQQENRFVLNRKDPLGYGFDFTDLDAMAEVLYGAT
ncbi:AHH domain-containing protein [Altererythrobacter sp. JGD-16]|uniref:AHH domain-containing protein n=1 Tax=Altererythrobacter lutimaris TaxID=2743979 RepID=A0A850H9X2_9SPHN|nr:AHH domain-containing protein [Altererythrobacter lutimaris]